LVVDRQKVRNNIRQVKERAGDAVIFGVLKGNAYGFGLVDMADLLRDEGIGSFAVTEPRDLVILRNSGFVDEDVLMLRSTAIQEELEKIIEYNAIATVGSYDAAVALNGIAAAQLVTAEAHVKIDTGMGRYGFTPEDVERVIAVFRYMPAIHVGGMYTHFNKAFVSKRSVAEQAELLEKTAAAVKRAGFSPGLLHAANSSALLKYPEYRMDAVRVGSALTGRVAAQGSFGLMKTGVAECPVVEIRWLRKGQTIGYGGDYRCKQPVRAATVPLGYGDGFCTDKQPDMFTFGGGVRAGLSGIKKWISGKKTVAHLNGKAVRVLGHVGMQHCVLDVTDVECNVGDVAAFEVNPIIAGAILPKRFIN